jgi:Fe-S oxidoreductase
VPFRARLIANFNRAAKLGSIAPGIYNWMVTAPGVSNMIKRFSGFAIKRSMPTLYKTSLRKWFEKRKKEANGDAQTKIGRVYLFCDEFTNFNDTEIGIKAVLLLEKLGYEVMMPQHDESGRAWMSKGLLRHAKKIANKNVSIFSKIITPETPLIGIEPSAILAFRDEYIDLADDQNLDKAKKLSKNVFIIDEFIAREIERGNINKSSFTTAKRHIKLHGHCHQKSLSSTASSIKMMSLPENYSVEEIRSGCCGMAGSFGFEKEHYDLSMKIGELVLFPAVQKAAPDVIIAAPGTSCRHQVKDGTDVKALHTVEVLYDALA